MISHVWYSEISRQLRFLMSSPHLYQRSLSILYVHCFPSSDTHLYKYRLTTSVLLEYWPFKSQANDLIVKIFYILEFYCIFPLSWLKASQNTEEIFLCALNNSVIAVLGFCGGQVRDCALWFHLSTSLENKTFSLS